MPKGVLLSDEHREKVRLGLIEYHRKRRAGITKKSSEYKQPMEEEKLGKFFRSTLGARRKGLSESEILMQRDLLKDPILLNKKIEILSYLITNKIMEINGGDK
jgi:hypothetical protein